MVINTTHCHLINGIKFTCFLVILSLILVNKSKPKSYCTGYKLLCPRGEFLKDKYPVPDSISQRVKVVGKRWVAAFEK